MSDRYIFAVTEATDDLQAAGLTGFLDSPLEVVAHASVAAFVSPVDPRKIRPRRKNLKIHHDAVNALRAKGVVLPMAFGMVADSTDDVRDFLARHEQELRSQLELVRGRVELSLRVSWQVDDLFAHVLSLDPSLAARRDALFAGGAEPTQEEKIDLGQRFASSLEAIKADITQELLDALSPHFERSSVGDLRGDAEVANLGLLVAEAEYAALEAAVEAAAADLPDSLLIKITGPIAPYSFIETSLS
jgi:hypothetical protein